MRTVEGDLDAASFYRRALPFLLADEARHNLILGLAGALARHPERNLDARLWLVSDDAGVVSAAIQTPLYNVVLARPHDDDALAALADAVGAAVPGVVGAVPEVHRFAELVSARVREARALRILALERIADAGDAAGSFRDAHDDDRATAIAWWQAFTREALQAEPDPARVASAVDQRLARDGGGIAFWMDDGEAVALAAYGNGTPNGMRIGPVYTPPQRRGRGYATALVGELSARLLAAGKRFCFLYTDAANPTANAIYERIGYVPVCESAELSFEARSGA